MTLDAFFQPQVVKPKQDPGIFVQEKCSDCGEVLDVNNPRYDLKIKGIVKPYCRGCAKKRLPKPKIEEKEEKEDESYNV